MAGPGAVAQVARPERFPTRCPGVRAAPVTPCGGATGPPPARNEAGRVGGHGAGGEGAWASGGVPPAPRTRRAGRGRAPRATQPSPAVSLAPRRPRERRFSPRRL